MEEFDDFIDEVDTENIAADLMDVKEKARVESLINKLKMYDSSKQELTNLYTTILEDDNVAYLLLKLSQSPIFVKHFPEFYIKNQYGEDVINCQQNSPYHKYGVFRHILTTIECVGNPQIPIGKWQKKLLKWTMFLHDIGKPYVKVILDDGTDSFAKHDEKSVELAAGILDRFYFTEEDKKIILTLIKYHDRYLNEGEITYDNMKFLASELNNSKELFYLLLDVKDSDARAKNVDVYNKFKLVKNKYIEFINKYMNYDNEITDDDNQEIITSNDISKNSIESISKPELDMLIEDVMSKRRMKSVYQPVIDLKKKSVYGYEVFTRIENSKNIRIVDFINYTNQIGKYEKIQQIMMINSIESFENTPQKEADLLFVNCDLNSYEKYVNKPRLYDMMARNKIVLEFQNYEKKDFSEIQKIITNIHKNKGFVALDNFGIGTLSIDDINMLDIDYIIPDISLIRELKDDVEKQKFLSDLVTYSISKGCNVIAIGVEDISTLNLLIELGVNLVQGYYFSKPIDVLKNFSTSIKTLLSSGANDAIS